MLKELYGLLKNIFLNLIVIFPFVLFLLVRVDSIQNDMSNSDALRWHRRSDDFAHALKTYDFASTYQRYHPGMTLMWITTATELGIKLYSIYNNIEYKTLENTDGYAVIDTSSKVTLIVILFLLLLLQYRYITALYDRGVALIYVLLIAVEPYMAGINRWYHLTSLEVFFTFCAFLALLLWSEYKIHHYIIKSGIFLGLAVLTKFSALFALPIFVFIFVRTLIKDKSLLRQFYKSSAISFVLTFIATIVILFPALWVTPLTVLRDMTSAAINSGTGNYLSVKYAETHPYLYYLVILGYKLSPLTLFLLPLAFFKVFMWKESMTRYTALFAFLTFVFLTITEQKIERYVLAVVPALLLLSAVFIARANRYFQYLFILALFIVSFVVFQRHHPFYSAYYSPVFGGPFEAYRLGLYDDNGEYSARAAGYLNEKGRDVHVYVPYNVESFTPYFKGELDQQFDGNTNYLVYSRDSRRGDIKAFEGCPIFDNRFANVNFVPVLIFECNTKLVN